VEGRGVDKVNSVSGLVGLLYGVLLEFFFATCDFFVTQIARRASHARFTLTAAAVFVSMTNP
jgi:hypothetical protein